MLRTIKDNLVELKSLELNFSSNQIRFDHSFQENFDFSNLVNLRALEFNLSFNEIQPDYLTPMFKQISHA